MSGAQSEITIACIQMEPVVGAKQANLASSLKADRAKRRREGARLIVLPELANSGYVFRDRDEAFALAEEVPGGRNDGRLERSCPSSQHLHRGRHR